MAAKYWIKLYHEIIDDPKMGRLPDSLWRRVIELFLLAGELDEEGLLPPVPDMAWRLRLSEESLGVELYRLEDVGILELKDYSGIEQRWHVANFAERQGPSDTAERMREYRKRKKEKETKRKKEDIDTDLDTYRTVTTVTESNQNVTNRNDEYAELEAAICTVAKKSPVLLEEFEQKRIDALFKAGYTAAQIKAAYTPGKPNFWSNFWRGQKGQTPTLKDIVDTIGEAVEWQPSANGHTAAANGNNAESAWQLVLEHVRSGDGRALMEHKQVFAAVKQAGGWPRFKEMRESDLDWRKKEFIKAYGHATTA